MEGAVDAFHTGTLSFQNILENLADSLKAEQQELQAERDKLLEEQQRFAAEVSRIEQVCYSKTYAALTLLIKPRCQTDRRSALLIQDQVDTPMLCIGHRMRYIVG